MAYWHNRCSLELKMPLYTDCIVNTRSWTKMYAPLDGNKCCDVISIKRCISFWCPTLCKVSSHPKDFQWI